MKAETPSDAEAVSRLLEVIRSGSSSPAVVETRSGDVFVLKLVGSGAGPRGLLTEFLATGLAASAGLAVPPARPLLLAENFPWQIGTDEFDDLLQRSYGWNLGIAFIPDAVALGPEDLTGLLPDFLTRLAFVDRLLQNVDRTRKNPNLVASPLGACAIDFGSCLFLNRIASTRVSFPFSLPESHFLSGTPFATASSAVGGEALRAAIQAAPGLVEAAPADWLASLPFGREELTRRLLRYLEKFPSH